MEVQLYSSLKLSAISIFLYPSASEQSMNFDNMKLAYLLYPFD